MHKSHYPRPGQRLAPALLRDVLNVPLPARFHRKKQDAALRLGDLDERVWERFGPEACMQLAAQIIAVTGKAVRISGPLLHRHLPALPPELRVADLELEPRTMNCLRAAGLWERSQDLGKMTVEQLLGLRGFWGKSLVDLLTAIEHAAAHPEARNRRLAPGTHAHNGVHRYPQPGHRLAPQTLREFLGEPIPAHFVRGTRFEGLCLRDLDETVWEHLPAETIAELARLVEQRVCAGMHTPLLYGRRVPRPPKNMRLEDLHLGNRTCNCLLRVGVYARLEGLTGWTIGDLMAIKSFGAKCLLDLLAALETAVGRDGRLDHKLTVDARALATLPESREVHFSDPRLGPLLRSLDHQADTLAQMANRLTRRRSDPPNAAVLAAGLGQLHQAVLDFRALSLEEELAGIFAPDGNPRDREIIATYFGLNGRAGGTLEDLGHRHGLSRERVRQVCAQALRRNQGTTVFAPALDRALEFLTQRLPAPAAQLEAELKQAGVTRDLLRLETLVLAAEALQRQPPLELVRVGEHLLAVEPEDARLPAIAVQTATRIVHNFGAATVREVLDEMTGDSPQTAGRQAVVIQTLQLLPDFAWLDEKGAWFRLDSLPQYGLPNMIDKVLSLARRIEITRLHEALIRQRRAKRRIPPAPVLLEFCRQMPGVVVRRTLVTADPPQDWRQVLQGVEQVMVDVLLEHGPVLDRGRFEDCCRQRGINAFSFNAVAMSSPVIFQAARSVYALLGTKLDRKTIEAAMAARSETGHAKVLNACWERRDGVVCLMYCLSKAAISGGVVTVPVEVKADVAGSFGVLTTSGRKAGTMVAKNGCAWGLGPALRGQGAKPGDYLLVALNLSKREARVRIGDEDTIRRAARGKAISGRAVSNHRPRNRHSQDGQPR